MAKENSQKIKLLKLMELLRQETDEQHPMAATVVCQKLNDMEVACDRRTLTRDIQALNEYGYTSAAIPKRHADRAGMGEMLRIYGG